MTPSLALLLFYVLLLALFRYDPARVSKTSAALWLPVAWFFILGSRLPSQWLSGEATSSAADLSAGSPVDRAVYFAIIFIAIGVLLRRSFKWGKFFSRNYALFAILVFELLSVGWSDFPLIAFKRWFRDLGGYFVILVIVSDPRPLEATRTVLRRVSYILIPLSVVLVKYFPGLGRGYSEWTGAVEYVGAATSKNMLGLLCLLGGIYFFWDTVARWSERKQRRTRRVIHVNIAFLVMTVWLLKMSQSATSQVCLALGCLVVLAANMKFFRRRKTFLKMLVPATFCTCAIMAFGFSMLGSFAEAVGRNPTLTDRTKIWALVWSQRGGPLLGTGYQSFWLGDRLRYIWSAGLGPINESHNGYLEIFVSLGIVGLLLVVIFLLAAYRNIWKRIALSSPMGTLSLGIWAILLFYNMTEAALGTGILWLALLPGAVGLPQYAEDRRSRGGKRAVGREVLSPAWPETINQHR